MDDRDLNTACDEFPFRSTTQAGPGASLRTIDATDNKSAGARAGNFYARCGLNTTGAASTAFLVVPQPALPVTTYLCAP